LRFEKNYEFIQLLSSQQVLITIIFFKNRLPNPTSFYSLLLVYIVLITKTILTLGIIAGFVIGISFSSVYAGTSEKIGKKEVKTSDIRNNAIKTGKIRDGTILFADINQNDCATNEIMKWDGASWVCAVDLEIKKVKITDGDCDVNDNGWCPDGSRTSFRILEPEMNHDSFIGINIKHHPNPYNCEVVFTTLTVPPVGWNFFVNCNTAPEDGDFLHYVVIN